MSTTEEHVAAEFEGVRVPPSPFLTKKLVHRINIGRYEHPERKLSDKLVRPGDRVIEMGAGLGFVGAYIAKQKAGVTLNSFEANPELIPYIKALYKMNKIEDRATVHNAILAPDADRIESIQFHVNEAYQSSSVFEREGVEQETIDVAAEDWSRVRDSLSPDCLIIDIEGGELNFFKGAELDGVRAMIVEFHPKHYGQHGYAECLTAIHNAGFKQVHHRWEVRSFVREGTV